MLYPIVIEHGDEQTAFGVIVPDIAGCFSAGDTLDEAMENVREAIAGHLELLAEDGDEIPLAKTVAYHVNNPEYQGMTWAVVDIDVSRYLGKTEKVNVTLPSRLIHLIDEKVASDKARFKSRSAYLASLAEKELIQG